MTGTITVSVGVTGGQVTLLWLTLAINPAYPTRAGITRAARRTTLGSLGVVAGWTLWGGIMDVISTAEVPVGERFGFWREVHSKLWVPYDLNCEPELERGFRAKVGISDFGPVQTTLITTMPHSIHRTPKLIRTSDPEVFKRWAASCAVGAC